MNAPLDVENGIYPDPIVQKEHEKNESKALSQMVERSCLTSRSSTSPSISPWDG